MGATLLLFAGCAWLLTTKGTGRGPTTGSFQQLEFKQQVYGSQGTAGTYTAGYSAGTGTGAYGSAGTAGTAYGAAGTGTGGYATAGTASTAAGSAAGTATGGYATAGTASTAAGSTYGTGAGGYATAPAPASAGTAYSAAPQVASGTYAPWADSTYSNGPTTTKYGGPIEFSGNGGPRTIAGTKVIPGEQGAADDATDMSINHKPAEVPPPDYSLRMNPPMQMYMYRAQSEKNYPMRNVNLADLAGVLWYLHNEIVGFPDKEHGIRHFGITRIIRFKVTVLNPPDFWQTHQVKWGPFTAFGAGKCSVPNCESIWRKYGGLVGCQTADKKVAAYESKWQTMPTGVNGCTKCNAPLWFSLPGPCPAHEYGAKPADCIWDSPGGECGKGAEVTGAKDCTYTTKWYGEVTLDEMLNFTTPDGMRTDFKGFTEQGGQEYDKLTDRGTFTTFWDGILNKTNNDWRMDTVRWWFGHKYPNYPLEMGEKDVKCDFSGWHTGEFGSDPMPGVDR